jgi:hypothetical protein
MTPHQKAALEIINDYYFMLPNNGYMYGGCNSCDSRYKEGIECALLSVKRIILTLEFMSMEPNSAFVMDRINFYDEVQAELYKIKDGDGDKLSLNDLMDVFKK